MRTKYNGNEFIGMKASRGTTTQTMTAGSTSNIVIFNIVEYDTHSCYNSSTGIYTAKSDGIYRISYAIGLVAGGTAFGTCQSYILKNASGKNIQCTQLEGQAIASKRLSPTGATTVSLKTGDTIDIRIYVSGQDATTDTNPGDYTTLSIERIG